jgi:hypothetical protein
VKRVQYAVSFEVIVIANDHASAANLARNLLKTNAPAKCIATQLKRSGVPDLRMRDQHFGFFQGRMRREVTG